MNELKVRGLNDILIAVVDGLKGFPEAITTVYPQTLVQTCIVHLIRNSLALSSKPNGASAIRRSAKPGVEPGTMSFPFSRLRRRSAK